MSALWLEATSTLGRRRAAGHIGGGRCTGVEAVGYFHRRRNGVFEAAVGVPSVGFVSIDVLKVTVRWASSVVVIAPLGG